MVTSAFWNTGSGNWFAAANWDVTNPNPPPPILHVVPGSSNDVNVQDNSGVGTPFTVTYNGTSSVNTLALAKNATLSMTGGALTVLNGGAGFGTLLLPAATTFTVNAGVFSLDNATIAGTLSGTGTFRQINGTFDINAGANITIGTWLLTYQVGSGTVSTTNLNTSLTFANTFMLQQVFGNYPILNLNGQTLTLPGTVTLDGIVRGPGTLFVTGTGTAAGTVEDGATLRIGGTVTQSTSLNLDALLQVDAGGSYTLNSGGDIGDVGAPNIVNNGQFATTGSGQSFVSSDLTNNGTIAIAAGTELILNGGTQQLNGTVSGLGQLSLGFAHQTTLNTTALSVANFRVAGGNGGGNVILAKNISYANTFTLADTGTFDLNGFTFTLSGSSTLSSGNIDGTGTLRNTGSLTLGGVNIGQRAGNQGTIEAATFQNSATATQNGGVYLNGTIQNDAGATYQISTASDISGPSPSVVNFTNNGTLSDLAPGTSRINGNFTNGAGATISIAAGAQLALQSGTHLLNGAISGAGRLDFGFAHLSTLNTSSLTVAGIFINGGNGGGTLNLGKTLAYNGTFTFGNAFGTLDLAGFTLTLNGPATFSAGHIDGPGTIQVNGSTTLGGINLGARAGGVGVVDPATFRNSGTLSQTGNLSVNGAVINDAGDSWTMGSVNIENSGGGGTFTNNGTLVSNATALFTGTIGTAFVNAASGTTTVSSGALLRLSGTSTLGGTINGPGALTLAGSSTVNTAIATGSLTFAGTATLGVNLTYTGNFGIGTFSNTELNGHVLTLGGTSLLNTGFNTIGGPGTVRITGTSTLGGVSLGDAGGGVTFQNSGSVTQQGNVSLVGTILNDAGRTWTLEATNLSNAGASTYTNNGTLSVTKTLSATQSSINLTSFVNAGTLTVAAGALLSIQGGSTLGGTVNGAGALALGGTSAVNTAIATGALTFAGTTTLGLNLTYAGVFATGAFSALNLNGRTLTLTGSADMDAGFSTVGGTGTLRFAGAATIGGIGIGSAGNPVTLQNAGALNQTASIALAGSILNEAAGIWTVTGGDINSAAAGASFTNNGSIVKAGSAGLSTVAPSFTNNGLIAVDQGTLVVQNLTNIGIIRGVIAQNGAQHTITPDAPGATTITGGGGNSRIVVTAAPTDVDGGGGFDTLVVAASMTLIANSLSNVERIEVANGVTANLSNLGTGQSVAVASVAGGGSAVLGTDFVDVFSSGAGNDVLTGRGGNDDYYIDNAADQVIEAAGGGALDRVFASVSYALGAGQQVEWLATNGIAGTTAINLSGNTLAQRIVGNNGVNVLDGKGGTDILQGFGGSDDYYLDSTDDQVLEAAGGGTLDRVFSSASFTLAAGQEVEYLATRGISGTTAINLSGNTLAQRILGNNGVNVLDGKGGTDILQGFGGNDDYYLDSTDDQVIEAAGGGTLDRVFNSASFTLAANQEIEWLATRSVAGTTAINLTGNTLAQTINGNNGANVLIGFGGADSLFGQGGNDRLYGGAGNDILNGGADFDVFAFNTALDAATNVDTIQNYSVAQDTIWLDDAIFTGLALGTLVASAFTTGAAATDTLDRIIYNAATGALLFDADGSNAGAAIQFATIGTGLAMANTEFFIV